MAFERPGTDGRRYPQLLAKLLIFLAKRGDYPILRQAARRLACQVPYKKAFERDSSDNHKLGKVPGGGYEAGSSGRKLPLFLFWRRLGGKSLKF